MRAIGSWWFAAMTDLQTILALFGAFCVAWGVYNQFS